VKWGIGFASTDFPDPESAAGLAKAAEEAGFESLWVPQHAAVVLGGETAQPGVRDGKSDGERASGGMPDPLIWLAYVAAHTSRIRLSTGVLILPEHNPVLLAKAAATLDHLSGGRLMLGIGVGDLPEEFDAVGVAFANRGSRADEYIDAMRALWREDEASYHGTHVNFSRLLSLPKPRRGSVPLHIGGASDAAVARAGRVGDGYFPYIPPPLELKEVLPRLLDRVRQHASRAGRDPGELEFTSGGARTPEKAQWFADVGVHRLIIGVRSKTLPEMRDELARFGDEVIAVTSDL
jgi:probable F420-dependent oxidoreductase